MTEHRLPLKLPGPLQELFRPPPTPGVLGVFAHLDATVDSIKKLQGGGYTPTELATEAAVTLEPEGQGFRITRSALILRANVPNLDQATFARMAGEAEKNCPVSKVLNAEITLDAKLA